MIYKESELKYFMNPKNNIVPDTIKDIGITKEELQLRLMIKPY